MREQLVKRLAEKMKLAKASNNRSEYVSAQNDCRVALLDLEEALLLEKLVEEK
jgi:hypothetical protein